MNVRGRLGVSLFVAALGVTPLAQASPSEQTWVPGLHDSGDLDDLIFSLTTESAVATEPRDHAIPALRVGSLVQLHASSAGPTPALPSFLGRAPPALISF